MDATPELLAKLLARIDALEVEVATLKRPAAEVAMVHAIHDAHRSGPFTLVEVAECAASKPELNAAITAALGTDWNNRKLGKAFARLEGQDLDGVVVSKVISRKERAGVLWSTYSSACEFGSPKSKTP